MSQKQRKSKTVTKPSMAKSRANQDPGMGPATFRGCISMAVWLVALCIAALTVFVVVRGWPVEAQFTPTTPDGVYIDGRYTPLPECGWGQVTAVRPGEKSIGVSLTCPSATATPGGAQ